MVVSSSSVRLCAMDTTNLLVEVRKEIARLQKVVDLLEGSATPSKRRGKGKRKRKPMSAETKKKIAAARKAAWDKKKSKG